MATDRIKTHAERMRAYDSPYPYAVGVIDALANPHTAAPIPDAETLRRIREVLSALAEVTR